MQRPPTGRGRELGDKSRVDNGLPCGDTLQRVKELTDIGNAVPQQVPNGVGALFKQAARN